MRHWAGVARVFAAKAVLMNGSVQAQDQYPTKVVRIVAPAPGGNADIVARFLTTGLTPRLGQQVIVDNRGAISPAVAAKAAPDGYTILITGSPTWLLPVLQPGVPWDVKDFAPITLATSSPSLLVVHPSVPVKSVRQLIALAKARPGEMSYASAGNGNMNHLAAELFNMLTGVKTLHVPYKGGGQAMADALGGNIPLVYTAVAGAVPHVKSGKLVAIAVSSRARAASLSCTPVGVAPPPASFATALK